jgi:hypothetical protein
MTYDHGRDHAAMREEAVRRLLNGPAEPAIVAGRTLAAARQDDVMLIEITRNGDPAIRPTYAAVAYADLTAPTSPYGNHTDADGHPSYGRIVGELTPSGRLFAA